MRSTQARILAAIILILVFLFGTSTAILLNSDFGKLAVNTVVLNDGDKELNGLLYRPAYASADNRVPAIVIAHGISESKDMMSSLGLELSRRGFVVLCLDLLGHGQSGGTVEDGTNEPTYGWLNLNARNFSKRTSHVGGFAPSGHLATKSPTWQRLTASPLGVGILSD